MPTSISSTAFDTSSPAHDAFAVLADLAGFAGWLAPSRVYRGTASSKTAVSVGDQYTDHTPVGDMHGRVVEVEPDRRLVFVQATSRHDLPVRITYNVSQIGDGARVSRRGEITTAGWLRLAHPAVVAAIRAENRRTMNALRARIERGIT